MNPNEDPRLLALAKERAAAHRICDAIVERLAAHQAVTCGCAIVESVCSCAVVGGRGLCDCHKVLGDAFKQPEAGWDANGSPA